MLKNKESFMSEYEIANNSFLSYLKKNVGFILLMMIMKMTYFR